MSVIHKIKMNNYDLILDLLLLFIAPIIIIIIIIVDIVMVVVGCCCITVLHTRTVHMKTR